MSNSQRNTFHDTLGNEALALAGRIRQCTAPPLHATTRWLRATRQRRHPPAASQQTLEHAPPDWAGGAEQQGAGRGGDGILHGRIVGLGQHPLAAAVTQ